MCWAHADGWEYATAYHFMLGFADPIVALPPLSEDGKLAWFAHPLTTDLAPYLLSEDERTRGYTLAVLADAAVDVAREMEEL